MREQRHDPELLHCHARREQQCTKSCDNPRAVMFPEALLRFTNAHRMRDESGIPNLTRHPFRLHLAPHGKLGRCQVERVCVPSDGTVETFP
jgi:hypothetical protein